MKLVLFLWLEIWQTCTLSLLFFKCCSCNQRVSPSLLLSLVHSPWCTVQCLPAQHVAPPALQLSICHFRSPVSMSPKCLSSCSRPPPISLHFLNICIPLRVPVVWGCRFWQQTWFPSTSPNVMSVHLFPLLQSCKYLKIAFWKCWFGFFFPKQKPPLANTVQFLFFSCSPTRCPWYSLLMRFTPSPLLSPTAMSTFPRGHTHLTSPLTSAPNKVSPSFPSTVGMHGGPGALCAADRASIQSL